MKIKVMTIDHDSGFTGQRVEIEIPELLERVIYRTAYLLQLEIEEREQQEADNVKRGVAPSPPPPPPPPANETTTRGVMPPKGGK